MNPLLLSIFFLLPLMSLTLRADTTPPETPYAQVLEALVNEDGLINYHELHTNWRPTLSNAVQHISQVEASTFEYWENDQQLAFLLNAYNVFTLSIILQNYPHSILNKQPLTSIRQIPGVWKKAPFSLLGKDTTLDHLEHKMIREWYKEPRVHMALVCASIGCPPLRNEPYQADKLNQQLTEQTQRFLARPRAMRLNTEKRTLHISPLFDWFKDDFPAEKQQHIPNVDDKLQGVLSFLIAHSPKENHAFLRKGKYKMKWLPYDWSLNNSSP